MPVLIARLLALVLLTLPLQALAEGWALGGMDAVAYRSEGRAVPGRGDVVTRWAGQDWHFVSEENRAAFEGNPREYAPGLRGLCPVELAESGRAVPGDPHLFAIIGQRLYLLSSPSAREVFLADPRSILMRAKEAFVALGESE